MNWQHKMCSIFLCGVFCTELNCLFCWISQQKLVMLCFICFSTFICSMDSRAAERWVWWDHGPSQFEIFAVTFGQPAKIAADNKWLPAKISYQKWRLPTKIVFNPKNAIIGAKNCNLDKYMEIYIYKRQSKLS